MKKRVLFICVHSSARSQMAEAWLNHTCGEYFEAQSAGLEPGTLNPLAVQVMAEVGIDISNKKTQAVFDVFKSGQLFAYVITVCDENSSRSVSFPSAVESEAVTRCWYGKRCDSPDEVSMRTHGHGASRCQHAGDVCPSSFLVSVFTRSIQIEREELIAPGTHHSEANPPGEFPAASQ